MLTLFLLLYLSFVSIFGVIIMESSKDDIVVKGEGVNGGLGLREVTIRFPFPGFLLTNP